MRKSPVPADDDVDTVLHTRPDNEGVTYGIVAEVSYAIFLDAHEWLMEMLTSPGNWPKTEDDCD